uniref:hypothetical protein n=1 Tax=uncultured Prevotella sp. TaxID=159272 RepID=UPI0027E24623
MEEPICDVCNVITTVEANGKKLIVFYNKTEDGLFYQFSFRRKTQEDMEDFIKQNPQEVYKNFVKEYKNNIYLLNVAMVDNMGQWKFSGDKHKSLQVDTE